MIPENPSEKRGVFNLQYRLSCYCLLIIFFFYVSIFIGRVDQVKDHQSEAKVGLGTIAKKQETYFKNNGYYASSLEELGFISRPKAEYHFQLERNENGKAYVATAQAKLHLVFGLENDIWTIDQNLDLKNIVNAGKSGPELFKVIFWIMIVDLSVNLVGKLFGKLF